MPEPILTVNNITKTYPGVVALNNVSLSFEKGEVHALLGENGAGKSTLIKVIAGAIDPDSGTLKFAGEVHKKMTPALAPEKGVAVIYHESSLVESLTVAQNVFLGDKSGVLGNHKDLKKRAVRIFEEMTVKTEPSAKDRDIRERRLRDSCVPQRRALDRTARGRSQCARRSGHRARVARARRLAG